MTTIIHGDCIEVMATMDAASVDAIVCDPPYELGFMGKRWDGTGIAFDPATWEACLRVLKPGGHLLAFSGTRTSHRMVCAIEDAGFEIRDSLVWMFGSGFPKSLDVGKAIDKAAGAEREVVGIRPSPDGNPRKRGKSDKYAQDGWTKTNAVGFLSETAPATDAAKQWDGWGTALKPGHEPICLARKPLTGTVAANVLTHGTGALNIDGCRIETEEALGRLNHSTSTFNHKNTTPWVDNSGGKGRWPANVVLDEISAAQLDAMSGERGSTLKKPYGDQTRFGKHGIYSDGPNGTVFGYDDTGGASRFFYCAKASRSERNAGLDGMPDVYSYMVENGSKTSGLDGKRYERTTVHKNGHPTVKPISLMRWLVRLVTPPGGTVLDPFTGSGSTGCAAALEGLTFIGIEQDAEYVEIARKRIAHWTPDTAQLSLLEQIA